jgi:acyl-CoA synthetase (AMP-forming)/AMP-acid ligase II
MRNARRHACAVGQRPDDTVLVTLPLHYSYALVAQALAAFAMGSRLVLTGPPFSPADYAGLLLEHRITVSALTPSLLPVLRDARWRPPPSLRVLGVGGAAADPDDVDALLAAAPDLELYLTYGLTEAGPRVSTLSAHAEPRHRWTSIGTPLPGVRTDVRPVEGGHELVVESDTVLRRRVPGDRPDPRIGPDTVATGDFARRDEDGYLHLCGRLSDSLVVGGEKVWLPSVRELAMAVPGVRRATTRPHPQPRPGGYDLEVYVDDPDQTTLSRVEDALRRVLLRAERPHRITLHRATGVGWHK